ncbi:Uncharacterised protein [Bordetella pertussis]|nr:Uncharacterised protein [Bordetella pertussis]
MVFQSRLLASGMNRLPSSPSTTALPLLVHCSTRAPLARRYWTSVPATILLR